MGMRGEALEMVLHRLIEQLVFREQIRKLAQLGAGWQPSHHQQMCHLDKRRLFRQLFNRDSTVAEDAFFAINERDLALTRAGVGVAVVQRD